MDLACRRRRTTSKEKQYVADRSWVRSSTVDDDPTRSLVPRNNHRCAAWASVVSSRLPHSRPRLLNPSLPPLSAQHLSRRRRPGSWCSQHGKRECGSDFVPGASSAHPSHHFASRREGRMQTGVGEGIVPQSPFFSSPLSSAVWERRVDSRQNVTSLRAAPISH